LVKTNKKNKSDRGPENLDSGKKKPNQAEAQQKSIQDPKKIQRAAAGAEGSLQA
jgi:hypothetical protein